MKLKKVKISSWDLNEITQHWGHLSDDPLGMVVEKPYEHSSNEGFVCAALLPLMSFNHFLFLYSNVSQFLVSPCCSQSVLK